ncbi:hypothetical protein [Streptomyces sp. 6N223]|uniref:hypothetical protein n=1 Tax=Streptomyces sp. 6N223 TaxID=3457412 RepID=UPI003FD3D061
MYPSQRRPARLRALVPAAAVLAALALSACTSDDEGEPADTDLGDATEQTEEAPPPEEEETAAEEEAPAEQAGGGDVQPVEPGTYEYALGDTSDPVPFEEGEAQAVIELTTDQVDIGEHADLEGVFEPDQIEGMRPAHIYMTVTNLSGATLESSDPAYGASTVNADGSFGAPAILFGNTIPGGCPDGTTDAMDIAVGDTVEQCTTVLIPEGTEPSEITWMMSGGEHELAWSVN